MVKRVVAYNGNSGFCVLEMKSIRRKDSRGQASGPTVTVVGTVPPVSPGELVVVHGTWGTDAKNGTQLEADVPIAVEELPHSVWDSVRYLECGAIKGIGQKTATALQVVAEEAEMDPIALLEASPERLEKVCVGTLPPPPRVCPPHLPPGSAAAVDAHLPPSAARRTAATVSAR